MKKIIKIFLSKLVHKQNKIESYDLLSLDCRLINCNLEKEVRVSKKAELSNTNISYLSSIGRYSKITYTDIGKYCAISWDVTINAISHPYNHLTISAFPYVPYVGNFVKDRIQQYQKVTIKNDVWIGANSVIMPNITIGNGAIVGAGAVVTKDVPDYAIVAGVPAKVIKYRFSKKSIKKLLDLQWWDLDPKIIKENIDIWGGELDCNSLKRLEEICK